MEEQERSELKSYITDRTSNITNDCRTFLWVRTEHGEIFDQPNLGVGGGNILMAVGLFATVEYLSKIGYILDKGVGSDNATDCFIWLIKNLPPSIKLFADTENEVNLNSFWNVWRNKLAHLVAPKHARAETVSPIKSHPNYQATRNLFDIDLAFLHPFYKRGELPEGWWCSNVDKLTNDLDRIARWLASNIAENAPIANVQAALAWINSELS